jgi:uncharacterized protein YcbK (DUF882 family)
MHPLRCIALVALGATACVPPAPHGPCRAPETPECTVAIAESLAPSRPAVPEPEPPPVSEPRPRLRAPAPAIDFRYAVMDPITFRAINTEERVSVRLYHDDGDVDRGAVHVLAHLMRDLTTGEDAPIVIRTLQLIVRVAHHFDAPQIDVVSAYRSGLGPGRQAVRREGYHSVGSAVDFSLPGQNMREVAAYARTLAHVGVGYYPRHGFVHLDSRDVSFFWENAGDDDVPGWDRPLDLHGAPARDAAWLASDDVPWDPPRGSGPLVLNPQTAPGRAEPRDRLQAGINTLPPRQRPVLPLRVFEGAH